ncbi:TetR/AcrR family transcriptional regulator [Kurthia senegalensis]|uniref:TetR/AcrR family transcriptional regulator n=1 Tax=Kurthia senegalensis TaxID=1033740 RepID=UPI0002890433|nr:TetR/AcrR family transcriptional regulator [Kurthia senegalensis]
MDNQKITKEQRKEQLVNIALEMFGTVGYTKTKVSDIVSKADVSQGTFYWYFKSKLEIASYILERGNEQILQRIAIGYRDEKVPVSTSVQSSTKLFESLFRFAEENRFLMMLLFKGVHTEPKLQQQVLAIKKNMERAFAHNIEQAQKFHMVAENKTPAIQAIFIMSLMEGVLIRWLERDETLHDKSLSELVENTVHFEFFGIFGV